MRHTFFLFAWLGLLSPLWSPEWVQASDDDFGSDQDWNWGYSSVSSDSPYAKWGLELGGGVAIPINSSANYPGLDAGFYYYGYIPVLGVVSQPIKKSLDRSTVVDTSVFYHLTKVFQAGFRFSYALAHELDVSESDVISHSSFYENIYGTKVDFNSRVRIAEVTPLFKWVPWGDVDRIHLKPFFLGGIGYYNVHQEVSVTDLSYQYNFPSITHEYLGASAGAGLGYQFEPDWWLTIEGRYERIFQAGQNLQFFTPTAELTFNL